MGKYIEFFSFIVGILESLACAYLLKVLLKAKSKSKLPLFYIGAGMEFLTVYFIRTYIFPTDFAGMISGIVTMLSCFIVLSFLFLRGHFMRKILSSILAVGILFLSDAVAVAILLLFKIPMSDQLMETSWFQLLGIALSKTLLFFAYAIIYKFSKINDQKLNYQTWILLLLVPTVTCLIYIMIIEYVIKLDINNVNSIVVAVSSIGAFIMNVFVFYFLNQITEKQRIKEDLTQKNLQIKYYKDTVRTHENIKSIWHDMKYHMEYLNSLAMKNDMNGVRAYLAQSYKTTKGFAIPSRTSITALDAIINDKYLHAQQNNITIELWLAKINISNINEIDLCILVGNALENAIESCQKLNDGRFIHLHIYQVDNHLVLSVQNSMAQETEKTKKFQSTKNSVFHGYGIRNMREIAEKYDGDLKLSAQDGVFKLLALLSLESLQNRDKVS